MAPRGVSRQELLRDLMRWHRHKLTREAVGLPALMRIRSRGHLSQDDLARLCGVGLPHRGHTD
jgi:hypothetical protein